MIVIKILLFIVILVILVSLIIECVDLEIKIKDQDDRILQLEKRLEKYRKDRDDELVNIYDNISINNDEIKEIQLRLQKLERKIKSDKE